MKAVYKLSGRFPAVEVTDMEGSITLGCGSYNEKHYTHRPILAKRVADAINNNSELLARIAELEAQVKRILEAVPSAGVAK
jgi:hypothetical protein